MVASGTVYRPKVLPDTIKVRRVIGYSDVPVHNHWIITTTAGEYLQSYGSIVAFKGPGIILLDRRFWNYSQTTGRYRRLFLGEGKAETTKKLLTKKYRFANLN